VEDAKIGLPFRQLLRNADPGSDPNTLAATTVSRRGAANGFTRSDNAQLHAVSDPGAVARFGSSTEPFDPRQPENGARLPSPRSEPRGRLAHTAILLFFMALLFLSGIYLGASLTATANLPSRAATAEGSVYTAIPAPVEAPNAASSATTADRPSEPMASPRSPTNLTAAEAASTASSSATALTGNGGVMPEMGSTATPAADEPVASARPAAAESLTDAPAPSATPTSTPPPIAPARVSAAAPDQPDLSDIQRQALLLRGDAFFSAGDVTSARLFYQRGFDAGDGAAALRLGATFDAAFLERAGLSNVWSDLKQAVAWYRRARDLGNPEAQILLKSLQAN
jgi:hypothetical protein